MWTCSKCGERIEDQFDACWRCGPPNAKPPLIRPGSAAAPAGDDQVSWRAEYRMFRGTLASWDQLFREAAAFASQVGPERLIGISHSEDHSDGVVVVWYWVEGPG
jgi:hypothetical protein